MTRFLIALSLLLVPVQAIAQRGMTTAVPVRYEYVFELAKYSCPALQNRQNNEVHFLLGQVKAKFNLTDDEFTVLMNYCIMYVRGGK